MVMTTPPNRATARVILGEELAVLAELQQQVDNPLTKQWARVTRAVILLLHAEDPPTPDPYVDDGGDQWHGPIIGEQGPDVAANPSLPHVFQPGATLSHICRLCGMTLTDGPHVSTGPPTGPVQPTEPIDAGTPPPPPDDALTADLVAAASIVLMAYSDQRPPTLAEMQQATQALTRWDMHVHGPDPDPEVSNPRIDDIPGDAALGDQPPGPDGNPAMPASDVLQPDLDPGDTAD